jgi:rSAM/selenodomain-associated transferase 2
MVADGGSSDGTASVAESNGARVVVSPRGRGLQLRVGASKAVGDIVLLLHADTWLPPDAGRAMFDCLRDPSVVGGAFWKVFRPRSSPLIRGSRFKCFLRLVLARRLMGDQAIFVRRRVLEQIGGVPGVPLMEEFELCRKLRTVGRLAIADAVVVTSSRRFEKLGVLSTYARMWNVTIRYYLGASPEELWRRYEK